MEFLFSDERSQKTSELMYIRESQRSQVEIKQNWRIPRVATSVSQEGFGEGVILEQDPQEEKQGYLSEENFEQGHQHTASGSSKKASVSGLEVRRAQEIKSAWRAGPRCC